MFERTRESWRRPGLSLWEAYTRTRKGFRRNHLDARSAQYAYYGLLVIPPVLILLIRAASELPWEGMLETLIKGANDSLQVAARDIIVGQIRDMRSDSSDSMLYMASAVFALAGWHLVRTIGGGLNSAFGVRESRPWWMRWTLSIVLVLTAFLAMVGGMVLTVAGDDLQDFVAMDLESPALAAFMGGTLGWALIGLLMLVAAATIYWILPSVKLRWVPLAPGSLFATGAWIALSTGFRIYKDNFNKFNETYGALGGVIVLLAWLYLSGAALFLGGQINAVLYHARERAQAAEREETGEPAPE